ncbi:C-C motif chemokine 20a.3 [Labrus bergylta]|uniref:C-C motif chemokine n=1 Tax=Labrus bergylta TaxID=56723 RepID=A0A3Q3GEW9_9LABR|nr:C-C motif chemokine 20-like [Labrus bergylta]
MVSIKATVMVITLLTFCLLGTASRYHSCCRSYISTKLPFSVIKGYSVQCEKENCPIGAIIFHTKKGKDVCTNPALNWVMNYVNRIRTEAQIAHNNSQSKQ